MPAHGNYAMCRPNCAVSPLPVATHSKEVAGGGPLFAMRNRLIAALRNPVVLACMLPSYESVE
jgi:hypothetical protein